MRKESQNPTAPEQVPVFAYEAASHFHNEEPCSELQQIADQYHLKIDEAEKVDRKTSETITLLSCLHADLIRLEQSAGPILGSVQDQLEQPSRSISLELIESIETSLDTFYNSLDEFAQTLHRASNNLRGTSSDYTLIQAVRTEVADRWQLLPHRPCEIDEIFASTDEQQQYIHTGRDLTIGFNQINPDFYARFTNLRTKTLRLALRAAELKQQLMPAFKHEAAEDKKRDKKEYASGDGLADRVERALLFKQKLQEIDDYRGLIFPVPVDRPGLHSRRPGVNCLQRSGMTEEELLVFRGLFYDKAPTACCDYLYLERDWLPVGEDVTLEQATNSLQEIFKQMLVAPSYKNYDSSLCSDAELIRTVREKGFAAYLEKRCPFFDQLDSEYQRAAVKLMRSYAHALADQHLSRETARGYGFMSRQQLINLLALFTPQDITANHSSVELFEQLERDYSEAYRREEQETYIHLLIPFQRSIKTDDLDIRETLRMLEGTVYERAFGRSILRKIIAFLERNHNLEKNHS